MDDQNNALAPRQFSDVVRDLAGGTTAMDLTELLAQVVSAVIHHRKKGKLTLELTFTPNGENAVTVHDNIKVSVPQPARTSSVFYVKNGSLVRDDPRQERLPLRTIEAQVNSEPPRSVPEPAPQPLRVVG